MRNASRRASCLVSGEASVFCALASSRRSSASKRGLPEEHVRADRGSEYCHQHEHEVAIPGQARQEGRQSDLAPGNPDAESRGDVGEQHKRERFQIARIAVIGDQYLGRQASEPERRDVEQHRAADHEPQRVTHGCDVGCNIQCVGGEQKSNDAVQQCARECLADFGGKASPGDGTDARAHQLNGDHERCGEKHRPAQRVAELRAALEVGGDTAWIVIGGTGD